MANQILSFTDVKNGIALYQALPSATLFRGLTGYGLVIDGNDQEIIAEVSSAKAIWKPMYLVISGGRKHGREKLSESMIQLCLEEFLKNPLWAVLKSTSGFGLRLDGNGMVELVEAQQATAPITFEISHFGGRSILAILSVQLGKVVSQEIEWKGGFSYQNDRNCPAKASGLLVLNRLLATDDFNVERILADIVKEANRISMMNTDGALPHIHNGTTAPMMQVFLRQELTALITGTQLDRQNGFDYAIRQDGIEVQMRLLPYQTSSAEIFETAFTAFQKECARVQMLYCQSLTENQKQKAGKPSNDVFGVSDVQWLNWQAANRGDGVIAFHPHAPRRKDAVFPSEGWFPKEGERHRVLCIRKGNGFCGFPAPPTYVERYIQKDDHTATLQLVLVNFDGREKVVSEKDVPLSERWEWESGGRIYTPRAEMMQDSIWIVEETNGFWRLFQENVRQTGRDDINGRSITEISLWVKETITCPAERRFRPEKIWAEPLRLVWGEAPLKAINPSEIGAWCIKASAKNPDGKIVDGKFISNENGYKWDELPENLRKAHLAEWPLCQCGRLRHTKGVSECEFCRDYRPCADCGKETRFMSATIVAAKQSGEKLYCRDCRIEWVNKWEAVNQHITPNQRAEMATEANLLLSGEVITGEEANNLLREKGWDCSAYTVISVYSEYRASLFAIDELQLIATLPSQSSKEFLQTVEMILKRKNPREDDFYRALYGLANCAGNNILSEFLAEVPVPVEEESQKIDVDMESESESVEVSDATPTLEIPASSGFQHSGGRDFQCPSCKCFQRITKGELKAYQAGERIKITCTCGYSDFVQAEALADTDNGVAALDLSRLAEKWGARAVIRK